MANKVDFTINLNVNGTDQTVQARVAVGDLRAAVEQSRSSFDNALLSVNNWGFALKSFQDAVNGIASSLNELTEESRAFGGAMAAANTMAGKSGEDFERLKGQVAELSKTIPIARDELANGLYQVISNGVPEDNWIEYLEKSAKASVGGIADLGETVKVTSTVIKNYGLEWDAAGEIQDKIQLTAKNGVTSFEQMAQALPRVTAQAATLGVSVDELMASFATLTGVSGNTAEVSTQLAAIFTALIKPSSEATEMAQQMGIQFDAAAIQAAGGMSNFITQLDKDVKSFAQSSGMLEQEIYGKLFGSAESLRALTPLTGKLADKFKENIDAMAGSTGTINDAFDIMAQTGKAKLQLLNNKLGEYTDMVQNSIGNMLPYINFASQMTVTASSAMQLVTILRKLNITSKATAVVTSTLGPLWQVCSATMRGAAVSATTLKLAIRGLMIATGVGIAVTALTMAVEGLCNATDRAGGSATDMATAESAAADSVKQAYDSTLKSTYSDLMAKYERLTAGWKALTSEHQKIAWIRENQSAFNELRIKIDGVTDAEKIFNGNTDTVVKAFEKRAQAAAYAAKLTELYKQQLDLKSRVKDVDKAISDTKNKYNHSDDVANRDNPYAKQNADRAAGLAGIAADMKRGGDGNVEKLHSQLKTLNEDIKNTTEELKSLAGADKEWINGSIPKATPTSTGGKTGTTTTTTTTDKPEPLENSIDWYEKQLQSLREQINAAADEGVAKVKQEEYERVEGQLKDLKVRIGVEKAPEAEVKTELQRLNDELKSVQEEFDNATTVEAKVEANARITDLQKQIDAATNGKLTIEADVEPTYIVQGSVDDKRQSYSNAKSKAGRIQTDYEIGLIGKDEAEKQMAELNKQIESLGAGLKPLKLEVDTSDFKKAFGSIKDAWGNIQGIGSGVESITSALEGNGSAWQKVCGVINGFFGVVEGLSGVVSLLDLFSASTTAGAAATTASTAASTLDVTAKATEAAAAAPLTLANQALTASFLELAAASYFAAHAYIPFAGYGIALGYATSAVASTKALAATMAFATGGIVPGTSRSGDKVQVRVNSGEMILNTMQQARLFAIANGAAVYGAALGVGGEWQDGLKPKEVRAQVQKLQRMADYAGAAVTHVEVSGRIRGRDLVLIQQKEENRRSRS